MWDFLGLIKLEGIELQKKNNENQIESRHQKHMTQSQKKN